MADRAYIVLRRSDLPDNFLEVLDLQPNTSQRRFPYETYGQTHYLSHFLFDGVNNAVTTAGAGPIAVAADTYGLSGYLIDRVENTGGVGTPALTAVEAWTISVLIEGDASAGNPLTAAVINTHINTPAGVSLSGLQLGNSSGSVQDILAILAGARYKIAAGAIVEDGANAYVPGAKGFFTTPPNRVQPTITGPGGRKSTDRVIPEVLPVQTPPEDVEHVFLRHIYDTGDLHRSALLGVLSELKAPTYSFLNASETYGAGGTAIDLSGTAIPATGVYPAVQVYDENGNVI
jgi:hypothetical protein